ncbi:hypothetical protein ES319_A10G253900v1 [Gossypium barbadense]|uniref:ADP-ribosyl cyclase/cyclic ADP-ribose hydrolase n=1 Tax=Gossypium barbadense TaxID=3634 RepID=A0A5J5U7P5_GOSBA|nr:hypothetical protein ES319_A10G253900v1 [Gossypium barbadense]
MMLLIILVILLLVFLLQKYEKERSPAKESSHCVSRSLVPQSDNPYPLTSSSYQVKHQVFLSFRGEDVRLNFTSHLLKALKDTGINVFFDEETLERGKQLY